VKDGRQADELVAYTAAYEKSHVYKALKRVRNVKPILTLFGTLLGTAISGVEMWMNEWETKCELNLAETCVESLTINQLLEITGRNEADLSVLLHLKMTYGEIKGSDRLRAAVASLYSKQNDTNILITHGTIGANMLVHKTLIERGDRVISIVPTYQQHYSIPKSIGAEMELLHLRE